MTKHTLKNLGIVIVFLLTISIILGILFFPFLFPMIAIYQRNAGVEHPFLIKFDLFNPTYGVLTDPTDTSNIVPSPELGFSVARLKRKNFIFFEVDEVLLEGKFDNETKLYAKSLLRNRDFTKASQIPNNMIISFSKEEIEDDRGEVELLTKDDVYFEGIHNIENPNEISNLDNFSSLKNGMKRKDVVSLTGRPTLSFCLGSITNLCENQYKFIKDSNINFVALAFESTDKDFPDPDARLERVLIIKNNRSYIEVPTKEDGTFDFKSALEKIE